MELISKVDHVLVNDRYSNEPIHNVLDFIKRNEQQTCESKFFVVAPNQYTTGLVSISS